MKNKRLLKLCKINKNRFYQSKSNINKNYNNKKKKTYKNCPNKDLKLQNPTNKK